MVLNGDEFSVDWSPLESLMNSLALPDWQAAQRCASLTLRAGRGAYRLLPIHLNLSHLAVPELYPFIMNWESSKKKERKRKEKNPVYALPSETHKTNRNVSSILRRAYCPTEIFHGL